MARVDISDGGRAGSITYRAGRHTASFDWEFALSPALAVITGPRASEWDRVCPWAGGRQAEIFDQVAQEVIRQKAPGHRHELDLAAGVITILESDGTRSVASPLDPVAALGPADLEQLVDLILRDGISGPTVDALAQIDHPRANSAVEEASRHHLSVDVRLAAAEALHARGRLPDLDAVLTRELRMLSRPADGLSRALRLAAADPTPAVKQALLWASWNQTECAPACALLLLSLVGGHEAVEAMCVVLPALGLHRSAFERKAAFEALCQRVGMTLD